MKHNMRFYICDPLKNKECSQSGCMIFGRGGCCLCSKVKYSKPWKKASKKERLALRELMELQRRFDRGEME